MYGLKQVPCAWFAKFSATVEQFGFQCSSHDEALFVRQSNQDILSLMLYVGDLIMIGDRFKGIVNLKIDLSHHFGLKFLLAQLAIISHEPNWLESYILSRFDYR